MKNPEQHPQEILDKIPLIPTKPSVTYGGKCSAVFGVPSTIKPLRNVPAGKARFRFRNDAFAEIFFKTAGGVRRFILEEEGSDFWTARIEISSNRSAETAHLTPRKAVTYTAVVTAQPKSK